jgi:hypothetical protein
MRPSKRPDLDGRTYRVRWWLRAFAIVWTALGALVWGGTLSKEVFGSEDSVWWHFVVAPIWIVGGILWTAHVFKATVTLFHDAIETYGLWGRVKLRFDQIRGHREYLVTGVGGTTHYFKLEPNDDRLPTLDFIRHYDFDTVFYDWFSKLPDLDAMDKLKGR